MGTNDNTPADPHKNNPASDSAGSGRGESDEAKDKVGRANLRYLGFVLLAGAVGGLLYWVIAKWTGTSLPAVFGAATVPVLMFVGALAAAIGVYVLTASDLTAMRTYVFAVLCGLAWQPMIAAGSRIATNATASNQNAQLGQQVDQIKAANGSGNTQQIAASVNQTSAAVTKTLELSQTVTDPAKKTELAATSNAAIQQLQLSAAKTPDASVDALKNVSASAVSSGEPTVALNAIHSLQVIGDTAEKNHDLKLTMKVQEALKDLANRSNNSIIKRTALLPVPKSP
jgi:hypothetical protein